YRACIQASGCQSEILSSAKTGPRCVSHERRERNGQIGQPLPSFVRYQRGPRGSRGLAALPASRSSVRSRDDGGAHSRNATTLSLERGSPVRWMEANNRAFRQPPRGFRRNSGPRSSDLTACQTEKGLSACFRAGTENARAVQLDNRADNQGTIICLASLDNGSQGKSYRGPATLFTTRSATPSPVVVSGSS
ncbi:hypothetical protein K0M31_014511, partial [Melipona bicolor]